MPIALPCFSTGRLRGIFLDWCVEDASFDFVDEGVAVMKDFVISALQNTPRNGGFISKTMESRRAPKTKH